MLKEKGVIQNKGMELLVKSSLPTIDRLWAQHDPSQAIKLKTPWQVLTKLALAQIITEQAQNGRKGTTFCRGLLFFF
jgi:hypothetical protein